MKSLSYTNFILTVIAACLVFLCFRFSIVINNRSIPIQGTVNVDGAVSVKGTTAYDVNSQPIIVDLNSVPDNSIQVDVNSMP